MNITKIIKALKNSEKIYFQKINDVYYISNAHILIKLNSLDDKLKDYLSTIFDFRNDINNNECYSYTKSNKHSEKTSIIDFIKGFHVPDLIQNIENTHLIDCIYNKMYAIYKGEEYYQYYNLEYTSLFTEKTIKNCTYTANQPNKKFNNAQFLKITDEATKNYIVVLPISTTSKNKNLKDIEK